MVVLIRRVMCLAVHVCLCMLCTMAACRPQPPASSIYAAMPCFLTLLGLSIHYSESYGSLVVTVAARNNHEAEK